MVKQGQKTEEWILRFGKVAIIAHWVHTITFFVLAFTGLIIFAPSFAFLTPLFGGIQGVRLVHRIMAVAFIVVPIISLVANFNGFKIWWKDITTWGKNEIGFFKVFLRELFGYPVEFPPQTRFNAGEKLNSLLQIFGCGMLALTGIVIWFKQYFPVVLVQWALPLHDVFFIINFCAALGHAYMACGLPATKHGINGMISGYVKEEWAKHHYPLWVKQVREEHN